MATVIGEDSDLGTVYPATVGHTTPAKLPKTAQERIEALRNVGVDVSNLFAMKGANGGEHIVSNKMVCLLSGGQRPDFRPNHFPRHSPQPPPVPSLGNVANVPHDVVYAVPF